MLAVHWSPVKNTKGILKNGIRFGRNCKGVYCLPLVRYGNINRWWAMFDRRNDPYNCGRPRQNGFVFRVVEQDLPAVLEPWFINNFMVDTGRDIPNVITSLKQLDERLRDHILWWVMTHPHYAPTGVRPYLPGLAGSESNDFNFNATRDGLLERFPDLYLNLMQSPGVISDAMWDLELVLIRKIDPKRIIRVISQTQKTGRQLRREERNSDFK